ncbi:DDE_3 domain-containing protein, partial [Trichonephila clavipes]
SCVFPKPSTEVYPLHIEQRNKFPGSNSNELLYSSQRSQGLLRRVIQVVCLSGGNNLQDTTNSTMLKAVIAEDYSLERMEWPAQAPDLNPIKHIWDCLGRHVGVLIPKSLHELKQELLHI